MRRRSVLLVTAVMAAQLALGAPVSARRTGWLQFGRDAQHSGLSTVAGQRPLHVRWSTPVDLQPQYTGGEYLLIHYGSPLVTRRNTVVLPVKIGATGGFRLEARRGDTGAVVWTEPTDYVLPPHNWVPSVGPVLVRARAVVFPGAGGTVLRRSRPDRATGALQRLAFYGIENYEADPSSFTAAITITTPITSDTRGNLFFGFIATAGAPLGLESGIARISRSGNGTWVSAAVAAGDPEARKVPYGSAPALSLDRRHVYVPITLGDGSAYLVALDSATLAPIARVRLYDVKDPSLFAYISDDGTASPTVGPDGDVYFGVLSATPTHSRGWMLHFSADLQTTKTPGAFGWDVTPSIVPLGTVPSYGGTAPYLLLTKYNDYAGAGGSGVNRMAILDPQATMVDPVSGAMVMNEVLTIAGPTADDDFPENPLAVREWCINTAVVDPLTRSAFVNNEDGLLYRWDLVSNVLADQVVLTWGIGEAYTPTLIGPDGTVYAINDATLFAVDQGP